MFGNEGENEETKRSGERGRGIDFSLSRKPRERQGIGYVMAKYSHGAQNIFSPIWGEKESTNFLLSCTFTQILISSFAF